ncbi:Thioredoxin [Mesomycoplasma conjunctivae]|uniref:Thioredoxin n=1 Tax=Mesomycoplasma conjunctivae (strain ATCC 25834 / NCTC 10147 / HRC/581) TaxID=572263 RepID=C5J5L7_MESCH|nr:thioredoxin family protein [Mesomycoplasma conjunctivae]CAT04740.1 Thioredoxin [Mesomycoplasma conjunctivae]VEU65751.1 Thioredoxin [Mesomycoplasma conjunctivae]
MPTFNLSTTEEILSKIKSSKAAILVFHQPGCGMCVMFDTTIEETSAQYPELDIIRFNIRENIQYAREEGITGTPTTFFYKDGKLVAKEIGYFKIEKMSAILKEKSIF